jgi:iron complex transport system ATP-binding protein
MNSRVEHALGWDVEQVTFTYAAATRAAVQSATLHIRPAECTAVLGPNGSGKSTLLRLLLGALRESAGRIEFGGRLLAEWTRRDLALTVGVVPQHEEFSFPIKVRELVAMGRYPHLGLFRPERAVDRDAIDAAMARCDVLALRDRLFESLSGGERQRVRLARALAQEPRVLALDEPTLALDVRHEMEIFELIRELSHDGVTVLLVTHSLNLAARYADELVLLDRGTVAAAGSPADVLRQELLERVYEWPLRTIAHPGPGRDAGAIQITPLAANHSPAFHSAP